MMTPAITPEIDTDPRAYPAAAAAALRGSAHRRPATTDWEFVIQISGSKALTAQSTNPAVTGTEMLSSSRTGIVSTNAAAIAAASGPTISNAIEGRGTTCGAVQIASAM